MYQYNRWIVIFWIVVRGTKRLVVSCNYVPRKMIRKKKLCT
jgi:hypothetical protein